MNDEQENQDHSLETEDSTSDSENDNLDNENDGAIADLKDSGDEKMTEKSYLEKTIVVDSDGRAIVTNVDDILVLVNKERSLPADYIPEDLVIPNIPFPFTEDLPKKYMRQEAAQAIERLFAAAKEESLDIYGISAYRSYQRQKAIFEYNAQIKGEEIANQTSAYPGESEHQTGLAMDITSPKMGFKLLQKFGETPEGQWIVANAHKYGFIIRYPQDKESITGYQYEPWHLRYVGEEIAEQIAKTKTTLEEFMRSYTDEVQKNINAREE